jgi:hypothetical protein
VRVVIAVAVTDAVAVKVDNEETVETVHKESDQRVETVAPVKPGRGHSVHKGSAPHAHRVNGQTGPPVCKETAHKETAHKETVHKDSKVESGQSGRRVRHANKVNEQSGPPVRKETVRHANRVSELHELSRLQRFQRLQRLQRLQHLKQSLRRRKLFSQRQNSQPLQSPPGKQRRTRHLWHRSCRQQRRLRASRGDSKPCYWHRHVQNTADSIAVA